MKKYTSYKALTFATFAAALVLMIVGCGDDSSMEPTASGPYFARVIDDSIESGVSMGRSLPDRMGRGVGDEIPEELIQMFEVFPKVGGEFTEGRFTVEFPAGATTDTLDLIIEDLTNGRGMVIVELGPHGAEFEKAVTLTIDLTGTTLEDCPNATIYWYDEDTGQWVDMKGTYDPRAKTVSAQLDHFSKYGGGRAGW